MYKCLNPYPLLYFSFCFNFDIRTVLLLVLPNKQTSPFYHNFFKYLMILINNFTNDLSPACPDKKFPSVFLCPVFCSNIIIVKWQKVYWMYPWIDPYIYIYIYIYIYVLKIVPEIKFFIQLFVYGTFQLAPIRILWFNQFGTYTIEQKIDLVYR